MVNRHSFKHYGSVLMKKIGFEQENYPPNEIFHCLKAYKNIF